MGASQKTARLGGASSSGRWKREEDDAQCNLVRRGWCLGDETFRQELLAQMRETIGAEHYGEERAQMAKAMAEQIIAAELKRRRWNEAALRTRPKGDPAKVALAARLRAETTMTVGWIAERLGWAVGATLITCSIARGNPAGNSHYQGPTPKYSTLLTFRRVAMAGRLPG